jgi:hypothetical protein
MGGRDPAAAYRRFVAAGLKDPPVNPFRSATRREISTALGLSHPDSAANMVRRIERQRVASARLRKDLAAIEKQLNRA